MTELNPDPAVPWYAFIVILLVTAIILGVIVVPILSNTQRLHRWIWREEDWDGITRRREFADGRSVSIFDVPRWGSRLARGRLARRPPAQRLAFSPRQVPWMAAPRMEARWPFTLADPRPPAHPWSARAAPSRPAPPRRAARAWRLAPA